MFIAMNRFKVTPGQEEEFETVWKSRESHLDGLPGFQGFHLLKGPRHDDYSLYSSHTVWATRQNFEDWTKSEAFRLAHKNAGGNAHLYIEGPTFEGFESVHEVLPSVQAAE